MHWSSTPFTGACLIRDFQTKNIGSLKAWQVQMLCVKRCKNENTLYLFQMQGNQDSFDQKLNVLQRIIEGVAEKLDKFQILISSISENNAGNLEQSSQNLSKTYGGGFRHHRDTSRVQIRPKEEVIVQTFEHHQDQEMDRNRQANIRSASTRIELAEPQRDSRKPPPNPLSYPPSTDEARIMQPSGNNPQPHIQPNLSYPAHQRGNDFNQPYPNYDPRNQPGRHNNWTGCICLMIWFGASQILGAISMIISGAVLLDKYFNPDCPSPYKRSGRDCCYLTVCKNLVANDSYLPPLILLIGAFVSGFIGILLLVKARKFYKDNYASCCD